MDIEYVRYLMLYSDQKFPFEMAKSDPGLTESYNRVNKYMSKHGNVRKMSRDEAHEIQSHENQVYKRMQRDFEVQRERDKNQIEQEVIALKKALEEKERELLRARASNNNNESIS